MTREPRDVIAVTCGDRECMKAAEQSSRQVLFLCHHADVVVSASRIDWGDGTYRPVPIPDEDTQ